MLILYFSESTFVIFVCCIRGYFFLFNFITIAAHLLMVQAELMTKRQQESKVIKLKLNKFVVIYFSCICYLYSRLSFYLISFYSYPRRKNLLHTYDDWKQLNRNETNLL